MIKDAWIMYRGKMKKNYDKIIVGLNIGLVVLSILILQINDQDLWFKLAFPISLIQTVSFVLCVTKFTNKFISFINLFLCLSYVFNFGHFPIKFFGLEFGKNVLFPLWYVEFDIYKKAFLFTILSLFSVFLGIYYIMILKSKKMTGRKENKIASFFTDIDLIKIRQIGYICFVIGIIPNLYINISQIRLFLVGGYINTFSMNTPDFVKIVALFVDFAFFAFVIGNSDNKKKSTLILIIGIAYKGITMISGGRGEAIVFIIGIFIVWENLVVKLSTRKILLLGVVAYMALFLLNFIASTRNYANINFEELRKIFFECLLNNQLTPALSEFGSTFATTCFTIKSAPGPVWGLNYILPIVCVLPNIGGFNSKIVDLMIFTKSINTYHQPVGGSYIAELFYSFSWMGCILAILLGIMIGYVAYKIDEGIKNKNYFQILIFTYMTPSLLFWIRGYFGALYRTFVWHIGFSIVLLFLIKLQKRKNMEGKND